MARLALKSSVVKKLFALSGNRCAFPGCNECIIDESGIIVGEICHIEAAEKGGARYNLNSDDEHRRSFENLILMCANHHKKTNYADNYTVSKLISYKKEHEETFADRQYKVDNNIVERMINKNQQIIRNDNSESQINNQANTQHIGQQTIINHYGNNETTSGGDKVRKSNKRIVFGLVFFALLFAAYYFNTASPMNNNKEAVYEFLVDYLNNINDTKNAHDFFADNVENYIMTTNVSPDSINSLKRANNKNYANSKATIRKETLTLFSKENNICYWRFWGNFSCDRPLLQRYQTGTVYWEFGINEDQKITSIKQIKHKESYTKKSF